MLLVYANPYHIVSLEPIIYREMTVLLTLRVLCLCES